MWLATALAAGHLHPRLHLHLHRLMSCEAATRTHPTDPCSIRPVRCLLKLQAAIVLPRHLGPVVLVICRRACATRMSGLVRRAAATATASSCRQSWGRDLNREMQLVVTACMMLLACLWAWSLKKESS